MAQQDQAAAAKRLTLIEGVLPILAEPTPLGKSSVVAAARDLAEAPLDAQVTIGMIGGQPADPREQVRVRKALERRAAELREALGGREPAEVPDALEEAEAAVAKAAAKSPRDRTARNGNGANGAGKAPSAPAMLETGMNGDHVRMAQQRMGELGYSVPGDGAYGSNFAEQVKDFQRHHDLKVDGKIGPKTTVAMKGTNSAHVAEVKKAYEAKAARRRAAAERRKAAAAKEEGKKPDEANPFTPEPAEAETPELKKGDEGEPVKEVQEALISAGTYVGDAGADGVFGLETRRGVRRIQRRRGLEAHGRVDGPTRKALGLQEAPIAGGGVRRLGKPLNPPKAPRAKGRSGQAIQKPGDATGKFNPALHPRGAKGTVKGGEFITSNSTGKEARAVRRKLKVGSGDFTQKVKQFQREHGLTVDGKVGAQTAAALAGATGQTQPGGLTRTSKNALQSLLPDAGSSTSSSSSKSKGSSSGSSGSSGGSSGSSGSSTSSGSGSSSGSATGSSKDSSSATGLLRNGASGSTVTALQKALGVKPTGTYDGKLKQAIERYQRQNGLLVDGIVGAQTAASLLGRKPRDPGQMGQNLEAALAKLTKKKLREARDSSASDSHRNVKCPECDLVQSATHKKCSRCGHDLTAARKAKFANTQEAKGDAWIDAAAEDLLETVRHIVDEAGEEALRPFLDLGIDLAEAVDSMAKATTPEPFSASKTSNWVARVGGLPAYIQHVAHDLMERGKKFSESRAIAMAVGIIKNWAHGHNGKGGTVHADTQAAAQLALRQWEEKKARAHAMSEAMTRQEKDDVGDKTTEQALKCPECGHEQSARLANCKKCGHDMTAARKARFGAKAASMMESRRRRCGRTHKIDPSDLEQARAAGSTMATCLDCGRRLRVSPK